jgi:hypothetical protein
MRDLATYMGRIAASLRVYANRWPWDGSSGEAPHERHRRIDGRTGASLLFTLDYGYHTSGWWKNPDYERCYHLSIASVVLLLQRECPSMVDQFPELTEAVREQWAKSFFGDYMRLLWLEGPFSDDGRDLEVRHYRLFVDQGGTPLLPRGEVYSRELTAAGWKSWSEVHGE